MGGATKYPLAISQFPMNIDGLFSSMVFLLKMIIVYYCHFPVLLPYQRVPKVDSLVVIYLNWIEQNLL